MSRAVTWANLGTDVSGSKTIDEVLSAAGLNYDVEKVEIQAVLDPSSNLVAKIPDRVATVRKDTGDVLGIVSPQYEICQNRDAFDFVDLIGADSDLRFVRAGQTAGGLVYIIGELPKVKILSDEFTPHVIFQNGHNGGISLRAAIAPLRIVCQNQFNMAFKDAQNSISIRHTSQLESKLSEAQNVLRSTSIYMDEVNKFAEKYAGAKITDSVIDDIINHCFPIPVEGSTRAVSTIQARREAFRAAYNAEDNQNFRGTAWGLINAYSDYVTHFEPGRKTESWAENRFTYVSLSPKLMSAFIELVDAKAIASAFASVPAPVPGVASLTAPEPTPKKTSAKKSTTKKPSTKAKSSSSKKA